MRDPRRDPRRGDVLHVGERPHRHRVEVLDCDEGTVHLRRTEGRGAYGREAWTTLDSWRLSMATAEVAS